MQFSPSSSQVAAVALGGALGATARWAIGTRFDTHLGAWPWSTLIVNLVGCVLIGLLAGRLARGSLGWDFMITGALGGFTTMSAFAVELNDMVEADRGSLAVLYAAVTIVGGVLAASIADAKQPRDTGLLTQIDDVR